MRQQNSKLATTEKRPTNPSTRRLKTSKLQIITKLQTLCNTHSEREQFCSSWLKLTQVRFGHIGDDMLMACPLTVSGTILSTNTRSSNGLKLLNTACEQKTDNKPTPDQPCTLQDLLKFHFSVCYNHAYHSKSLPNRCANL